MSNIVLNEGQEKAVKKLVYWYSLLSDRYFSIAGSAGTGKSTMVNAAIKSLGLDPITDVVYATPTGKAALVLTLKGLNACTIHRLIYRAEAIKKPVLDKDGNQIKKKLKDKDGNILMDSEGKPIEEVVTKTELKFKKREQLENPNASIILIDEGSMVTESMWKDILSFGKRVIILSDHKQLPPIGSKIIDPVLRPNVTLTEIMRQGKDSDILVAAIKASEGKMFKDELNQFTNYDKIISYPNKDVHIISHHHLNDNLLRKANIIICGKNATRNNLNKYIREQVYGFIGELPNKGDKLICRRNNNSVFLPSNSDICLINGLIGYVHDPIDLETVRKHSFNINFRPEFIKDDQFSNIPVNTHILNNTSPKNPRKPLTNDEKTTLMNFADEEKFEYAYCITTHLSQGSEWDSVIVFFEWLGDFETACKWLYTAITRAKKKLIIVRSLPKGEIPYWEMAK